MQPTLSIEFYLIAFLLIAIVLGALYIYYDRKRSKVKDDTSYIEGLKFMAEGENRRAIEKFKEAVRQNSENIDAYIKIGVILREEKLFTNAIRIHKDLMLRGNLNHSDKNEVKRNLALDYWYAGDYQKAEPLLNDFRQDKKFSTWVMPFLLQIYEDREDWQSAFNLYHRSSLADTPAGKTKLAFFKVKQGQEAAKQGEEKHARTIYKEALKIDKSCAQAFASLGDSYWKEKRQADAIHVWTDLFKRMPDKAELVFDRLERALYEKGQFSKIEELYLNLIQENESNISAIVSLANIYRKKGEYNDAMKLLQAALKKDVNDSVIKREMIKVLFDKSQFKEAAKIAMELVEKKVDAKPVELFDEDIQI